METEVRRVLFIGTGSLLDESIKSLLMHEPEFRVTTSIEADLATLRIDVDDTSPDVILFCHTQPHDWPRTFEILNKVPDQEYLRMIVIRRDDNILEIYDRRCVELTRNSDLITLMKYR